MKSFRSEVKVKRWDLTTFGEILVDLLPDGFDESGHPRMTVNAGGAPANVAAVAAARLGVKSAFIGKAGNDAFGLYLKKTLERCGVAVHGLVFDDTLPTTVAAVALSDDGERSFSFYRGRTADTNLCGKEIDRETIRESRIFHFGSLSLTNEPLRSATFAALEEAESGGCLISFDPNFRSTLWSCADEARTRIFSVLNYVDIIKISEEEAILLTGERAPEKAAASLADRGIGTVFVTLGKKGAYFRVKGGGGFIPASNHPCVDATGAGDAFTAAVLSRLAVDGTENVPPLFSVQTLKHIVNPPLAGFAIGFTLVMLELHLPHPLLVSFKYMGNMTTPLAMLFIGAVVSNADWSKIHFDRQILLALFGRFVVCPLGIILMAPVIGIPPLMTQVFTIQAAMPAPSVLPVLAKNYGADYEYAATLTVVTTVLAVVVMPFYMWVVS